MARERSHDDVERPLPEGATLELRPRSEIVREDAAVDAWTAERPTFEPKGPSRRFRDDVRQHVKSLNRGDRALFVAEYTSALRRPGVDVENVLLYNLGLGATCGSAIRFSWSLKEPSPAPSGTSFAHKLRYSFEPDTAGPFGDRIATIVAAVGPRRAEAKPLDFWLALKRGKLDRHRASSDDPFALRVTLGLPRVRAAAGLVKTVFDGAIAALQHDEVTGSSEESARLLAEHCDADEDWLLAAIRAPGPLGGVTPLVRRSHRNGLVWNPRDDDCLLGEIRIVLAEVPTIRVEAFSLASGATG